MKKYAVFQSPLAEKKLLHLLDYLEADWGHRSKLSFVEKFKSTIDRLKAVPYSFPIADAERGIHKCVITKQTSIYYRITNDEVEIITLMDNRQDQEKLFDEIKKHFAR